MICNHHNKKKCVMDVQFAAMDTEGTGKRSWYTHMYTMLGLLCIAVSPLEFLTTIKWQRPITRASCCSYDNPLRRGTPMKHHLGHRETNHINLYTSSANSRWRRRQPIHQCLPTVPQYGLSGETGVLWCKARWGGRDIQCMHRGLALVMVSCLPDCWAGQTISSSELQSSIASWKCVSLRDCLKV